jgi:short-subunit dehydrogenase
MSTTLFDLSRRTALVTGGNMGLGKAKARALAKARKRSDLERFNTTIVRMPNE